MPRTESDLPAEFQNLDQLWDPANAAVSEAALRALLPEAQKLTGKDGGLVIELHSLIARSEAVQEKFSEAHASIDQAETLLEAQLTAYPASTRIRWLIERGRLHILEKTPSQARGFFSEAWALSVNSGEDYFAVEIAQLMAATEPQKAQQEWIERAIAMAESSPLQKSKSWLGGLYTSLGWKFYDLRQYEKSIDAFRNALGHLEARGTARETFLAQWAIGKVLRAQGKTEEALAIQKTLLAEFGIGGQREGRLYEELAECLQALRRTAEAQLYFELAYRELSEDAWVKDNQPLNLKRMKDLGKVK